MSEKRKDFLPDDLEEMQEVVDLISEGLEDADDIVMFDVEDEYDDMVIEEEYEDHDDMMLNEEDNDNEYLYQLESSYTEEELINEGNTNEEYDAEHYQGETEHCCDGGEVLNTLSEMLDRLISEKDQIKILSEEDDEEVKMPKVKSKPVVEEKMEWEEDLVIDDIEESEDDLLTGKQMDWESDLVLNDEGEDWDWSTKGDSWEKTKNEIEEVTSNEPQETKIKSIGALATILLAGGGVLVAGLATVGVVSYVKSRKKGSSTADERVEIPKPIPAPEPKVEEEKQSPAPAPAPAPVPIWGYDPRPRPMYYRRGVG